MFPEITKQFSAFATSTQKPIKKKIVYGTQQMRKQWDEINKQLDFKSKNIAKKMPPDLISDFNKICRLKQIPDFYSHYLIHHAQKAPNNLLDSIIKSQIQSIMTGRSYYHIISQLLHKRSEIIQNLNNVLQILQGFSDINSGKNVSPILKKIINELLINCKNLDEVKQVQDQKILSLAKLINQIRGNAKQIMDNIDKWKQDLNKFEGADAPSIRKMKIIFPFHGINCVLHFLTDTQHLKKGFLKRQVIFPNKPDPFFEMITKAKRETNFQRIFFGELEPQNKNFAGYLLELHDQTPSKPQQNHSNNKKQIETQKQKERMRGKSLYIKNEQKKNEKFNLVNQKYSNTMTDSKLLKSRSLMNVNATYRRNSTGKKIKFNKKEEDPRQQDQNLFEIEEKDENKGGIVSGIIKKKITSVPKLNIQRAQKKMIVIDGSSPKEISQRQLKIGNLISQTPLTSKIIRKQKLLPYFKNKKQHKKHASIDFGQLQQIKNEKKNIQAQLKSVLKEKEKLQRLLKKTQDSNNLQQSKLQNKLDKSFQKFQKLKQKIINQNSSDISPKLQKSRSIGILKQSKISSPYGKVKNQLDKSRQSIEIQKQQIKLQKDEKKYLQKQIKQLQREKLKLQRILDRIDQRQNGFPSNKKVPPKTERDLLTQNRNLQSKLSNYEQEIKELRDQIKQRQLGKDSKNNGMKNSKVSYAYNYNSNPKKVDPQMNQLTDRLEKQKQDRIYLEKQIKQLTKEKLKIEKLFQQSQGKISKEKNLYERKLEKYEEVIQKLKNNRDQMNKSPQKDNKKRGSIAAAQNYLKKGSGQIINLYNIIPQTQKVQNLSKQKSISEIQFSSNKNIDKLNMSSVARRTTSKNLNIKNNKKTIEIVYSNNNNNIKIPRKNMITQSQFLQDQQDTKALRQKDRKMAQIARQKQLLQKKLQMSNINSNLDFKTMSRKLQNTQNQMNRYKQQIAKQRQRKYEIQQKMRTLRKTIRDQYQIKLQKQKLKFQKEKQQMAQKIQKQKQQRYLKQKALGQQYKFLKQMQKNQLELIQLLQQQKQQKKNKQRMLRQQIQKKQQLIRIIQIQQIKKSIQQEVRQELQQRQRLQRQKQEQDYSRKFKREIEMIQTQHLRQRFKSHKSKQQSEDIVSQQQKEKHNQKIQQQQNQNQNQNQDKNEKKEEIGETLDLQKKVLQRQIDDYKDNIAKQLQQIQQQNQRLKKLIQRIKNQQHKVMQTIKINIEEGQDQYTNQLKDLQLNQVINKDKKRHGNDLQQQQQDQNQFENIRLKTDNQKKAGSQDQYNRVYQSQFLDTDGQIQNQNQNDKKKENKKVYLNDKNFITQQELQTSNINNQKNIKIINNDSKITVKNMDKSRQIVFDNDSLLKQIELKAQKLINQQMKKKKKYKDIDNSGSQYKSKQRVQNLVEYYLSNPHRYPDNNRLNYSPKQKKDIVQQLYNKKKQVQDFQNQLIQNQKIKGFNSNSTNNYDPILSHLLNIRQAFKNQQPESLRRQLFPQLKKQDYNYQDNDKQIQIEQDQIQPPINQKDNNIKKMLRQKKQSKNFLVINKMRVMLLEETRKQKQRAMIQQESKRKIKIKNYYKKKEKEIVDQFQNQKKLKQEQEDENSQGNSHNDSLHQSDHQKKPTVHQNSNKKRKMTQEQKQLGYMSSASKVSKKSVTKSEKQKKSIQKQRQKSITSQKSQKSQISQKSQKSKKQKKQNTSKKTHQRKTSQKVKKQKQKQKQKQRNIQQNQFLSQKQKQKLQHQLIQQNKSIIKKSPRKQQQQIQKIQQREQNQQQQQQTQDKHNTVDNDNLQSVVDNNTLNQMKQTLKERQRFEEQRRQLQSDIHSYQESIRQYINQQQHFNVYQQYIQQEQFSNYLQQTFIELPSEDIQKLNNNKTIVSDVKHYASVIILVAKDKNNIQAGIGLFHKDYTSGQDQYICDYLMAHKMSNFLNLIFNFSRYLFKYDLRTNRIEYQFELGLIQDQNTLKNFAQFQGKCKRLGQVYVKVNSLLTRRYVLRRNLFQEVDNTFQSQGKGIKFDIRVQIHDQVLKQKGQGFINKKNLNHISPNVLLAYYLKRNQERLKVFRQKAENDLKYRQLLLTALMFEKKQVQLKDIIQKIFTKEDKQSLFDNLDKIFQIPQHSQTQVVQMMFQMTHQIPLKKIRRCTFNVDDNYVNYLIYYPQQAVTKIQTSNSSESGYFINIIPKHKLLMIQAQQYIRMSEKNPDLNVFFYVKHYIKNIVQVTKQSFPRVFIPQIDQNDWSYLQQISNKVRGSVFFKEELKIGWASQVGNSVIYQPFHKDLVFRKPMIVALLSANIQRIVQGTPICAKLII